MGIPPLDDRDVLDLTHRTQLPSRLARLLLVLARAVDAKMRLAIGGAVAAHDAGWRRHTSDLDVFARPTSARRLVAALRAAGLKTFWITDAHAVAYLDEDNAEDLAAGSAPTVRIDVLSTVTEPEASAIRTAVVAKTLAVPVKVFRPDHLAAIKFLAARPKDMMDFDELVLRGVDVERVRYIVGSTEPSRVAALTAHVRKLTRVPPPPRGVRDRKSPYLDRHAFERAFATAMAANEDAPRALRTPRATPLN